MRDFLKERGSIDIYGSKDATREAFSTGLIEQGKTWIEMIQSHNKTSHTYNKETAQEIFTRILKEYCPALNAFRENMVKIKGNNQTEIFEG